MVLSSYLSFSSLYEIEQRAMLSASAPISRCSSIESNGSSILYAPVPKKSAAAPAGAGQGHRVHFMPMPMPGMTTRSSSVSSGRSTCSSSTTSIASTDSDCSEEAVSDSDASASRPRTRPATPSVYTNHSQSLHRKSKRYSTEDGTLPHFGAPAWLKTGRRRSARSRSGTDEEDGDELELERTRLNLERAAEGQDLSLKRFGQR